MTDQQPAARGSFDPVDALAVTTLRTLAIDAVERAKSGHPGAPMALAPLIWVLYSRHLVHDPADPAWPDRDRFVLSAGHASMLQYGILHLTGYDLPLSELRQFRQWGSQTPGHPEHDLVPGVEVTTGPLGQGCGVSVGLALAEAHLASRFNRPGLDVVDHRTWVICSDGDLMEGVSNEAASLASHLGLGKLVWIWDDNRITIEGGTDLAFTESVARRFVGLGWRVLEVGDVNDLQAVSEALSEAASPSDRPTLVRVRSHIAWGSPGKQDSAAAHGAPLGPEEVRAAKRAYGWPEESEFLVPDEVVARGLEVADRGRRGHDEWRRRFARWEEEAPELAAEWRRRREGRLSDDWDRGLPEFVPEDGPIATRSASGKALNALADRLEELIGGSADLGPSCKTLIANSGDVTAATPGERNLRFGVREHAMAAFVNGLALHGGLRPFASTFLVFSDYMRPAIRLSALMALPVVYVFTHDSLWVGEDGPTHQPVEHILGLRSIPGTVVLRPGDANETVAAWRFAARLRGRPVALILSRQKLPVLAATVELAGPGVERGAYVLEEAPGGAPQLVIIATGSEVSLAIAARERLSDEGVGVRVVSMPSWDLFDAQPEPYRREVLPPGVPRLAVEAGRSIGWHAYVGDGGAVIGLDRFGASAPGAVVADKLGFTVDRVVEAARGLLG